MRIPTRILILITAFLILPGALLLTLQGQDKAKRTKHSLTVLRRGEQRESPAEDEVLDQLPIAEAFSSEPTEPDKRAKQRKKNSRYDKLRSHEITEAQHGGGTIFNTHWWQGLSALPNSESDAVVLASITDSKAHLSNDRTGVYSEFAADVKEVLKNTTDGRLKSGSELLIERLGGAVRFPSGTIQRYTVSNQRMPLIGRSYVLFLKRVEQNDFSLITGYELHGRQIRPLDGNAGISKLPFELYRNTDVDSFLDLLKASIAQEAEKKATQ